MNNLIEFFKKAFHIIVLAVLLILSIVMLGTSLSFNEHSLARGVQSIVGPIQKSGAGMIHRFRLGPENEELVKQNIELMRERENMYIEKDDTTLTEMSQPDSLHRERIRMYDYTYAHVIFRTVDRAFNYMIVDKGAKDGICRDMAVLSPSGVAGVVTDVSSNFATVRPILHPESRISAVVTPANQNGTVIWEGDDPRVAYLEAIPQHSEINIGDSVFTNGYSNIFPKGLLIGTVKEVQVGNNASFLTIKVKLATKYTDIYTVYLVENLFKSELDTLKANFKDE
ncbi:MAG: rod shape-determining protein MreC [Paludibacteraceae bacterium]|jgi:rod shape-determining protein MreC|nr:rod shape-determining protein MreC [Paludibacteraceae bacterium]